MRRDTVVFGRAGIVFGFVVGYMSAGWSRPAAPAPAATTPAGAVSPAPASSLDPDEARALETLAGRDPDEALERAPALPNVLTDLGASLVQSGRPAEGLAEFEKALALDDSHRNALYNKGIALMQLGRADEAAAVWEEVLRRHPDDPQLRGLRAQIDGMTGSPRGTGP